MNGVVSMSFSHMYQGFVNAIVKEWRNIKENCMLVRGLHIPGVAIASIILVRLS